MRRIEPTTVSAGVAREPGFDAAFEDPLAPALPEPTVQESTAQESTAQEPPPLARIVLQEPSSGTGEGDDSSVPLLRGGMWVVAGRLFGMAAVVVSNAILARWLEPIDFGHFILAGSLCAVGSTVALWGMNLALIRVITESLGAADVGRARRALRLGWSLTAVSIPAVCLGFPWFAGLVEPQLPSNPLWYVLLASLVLLTAVQQLAGECLRGFHELRWASLLAGSQQGGPLYVVALILLLGIACAVARPSLDAAVFLCVLALCCTTPLTLARLARVARGPRECSAAPNRTLPPVTSRGLLWLGLWLMLVQLLSLVVDQADLWIAGACCPADDLALYAAARRLLLFVAMPLQLVNLTILPTIGKLAAGRRLAELQRLLRGAAAIATLPAIAAAVILLLAGPWVLSMVFGSNYAAASSIAVILCGGQLLATWTGSCGYTLVMSGRHYMELLLTALASLAIALIGPFVAERFGVFGLAWFSSLVLVARSLAKWLAARWLVGVWTHALLRVPSRTS